MATDYHCWNCGAVLAGMILPVSRREECDACGVEIHVCRQCRHFDRQVAGQCREDRAEDVSDKTRANFCDYFDPEPQPERSPTADAEERARRELESLFGGGEDSSDAGKANPLDDLFDPDKLGK